MLPANHDRNSKGIKSFHTFVYSNVCADAEIESVTLLPSDILGPP